MHPIHQHFVSGPVFCKPEDLFSLLDQMDTRERDIILGPSIYPMVFQTKQRQYPPEVKSEQDMKLFRYNGFKEWCLQLARQTSVYFVVFSVLSMTLAWACLCSDEKRIPEVTAAYENEKREARMLFEQQIIGREFLSAIERKADALIADTTELAQYNESLYIQFCEQVIARLPRGGPP